MPARSNFQIKIALPADELRIPEQPLNVPSGAYFIWPFHLNIDGFDLRYSTAQLFTRLSDASQPVDVFFCIPGVRCEFSFTEQPGLIVQASSGTIARAHGTISVSGLSEVTNTTIFLHRPDANPTRILVLTQQDAEDAWKVSLQGKERLLITKQQFFTSRQQITLQSDQEPSFAFRIFPALDVPLQASNPLSISQRPDGTTEVTSHLPVVQITLHKTSVQRTRAVPAVKLGPSLSWRPQGVAEAPDEATFADAARWKLDLGDNWPSYLSNVFLRVDYTGDVARLSDGNHLLVDNFFNGTPWMIGMKRFMARNQTNDLQLSILPLRVDSPIFLEDRVRKTLPSKGQVDQLRSIELIPQYELTIQTQASSGPS